MNTNLRNKVYHRQTLVQWAAVCLGGLLCISGGAAGAEVADLDEEIAVLTGRLVQLEGSSEYRETLDRLEAIGLEAVPALIGLLLGEEDMRVRGRAWTALVRIGEPAVPALIEMLRSDDARPRGMAVATLGRLGPDAAEAVGPLGKLLVEEEGVSPQAVAMALSRIGEAARPILIEALEHPNGRVRLYAVRALCWIEPPPQDLQEARFGISEAVIERLTHFVRENDLFRESDVTEQVDVFGILRAFFSSEVAVNFETPGSSLNYDGYTISVVQTPRDLNRIRSVFRRLSPDHRNFPEPAERIPVRIRISGHVWKPGHIEYYSWPSLARVLKDTGGLTRLAGRVYILRSAGEELELIHLSHRDAEDPEVAELLLQDCDWIHVSNPHVDPWPKEWPRRSTFEAEESGVDGSNPLD